MLNSKKIKDDVYELIPAVRLQADEYAFAYVMSSAIGGGKKSM